jgi:hypothetical protein
MNNVVNGVKSRNGVASTEGVACTWPTEKKGLDALDRELALLVSVKRWVAAASGGYTPRSIARNLPELKNPTAKSKKPKKIDYAFQQRCVKVEGSCRQLGLRMLACRDALVRDMKGLEQAKIDESMGRLVPQKKRRPWSPAGRRLAASAGKTRTVLSSLDMSMDMEDSASPEVFDEAPKGPVHGEKGDARNRTVKFSRSTGDLETATKAALPQQHVLSKSMRRLVPIERSVPKLPKGSRRMKRANIDIVEMMHTAGELFRPGHNTEHERIALLANTSKVMARKWIDAALDSPCDLGLSESMCPAEKNSRSLLTTTQKFIVKRMQLAEEEYKSRVKGLINELRPEMETVRTLNLRLGAKWLMLIHVANRFVPLRERLLQHKWEQEVTSAAIKIQTMYRGRIARRTVKALRQLGPALKRTVWRYSLKLRCKRRRKQSKLLRKFCNDYATRWVQLMVYNFRRCVVKCQRLIRQWLACKRARIYVLSLMWDRVEKKEENQKLLRTMHVLSDTTDLDKDGDGSISSAEIKAAAREERGGEKDFLVINAKAFESSYSKAHRILVKCNLSRMKNSTKMHEIERLGRWNKWRGGFSRCCKSEFVKIVLQPYLAQKRAEHMVYSHEVRRRVARGATRKDMKSFVSGESWEDLMSRIKPSAPPLILYSTITEQKMLDFVMTGLLMQIKFDKELELRKLHIWDEIAEEEKKQKQDSKK